jgi:hypothetical protein
MGKRLIRAVIGQINQQVNLINMMDFFRPISRGRLITDSDDLLIAKFWLKGSDH